MENIELYNINNNEDVSSMAINSNKNFQVIERAINYLLNKESNNNGDVLKRTKIIMKANENLYEDEFFKITKDFGGGVCSFILTSKDLEMNMEMCIVEIRTFSNEKIICPTKYYSDKIIFEIDNLDDVSVTNPTNPNNDTNNKIFIII